MIKELSNIKTEISIDKSVLSKRQEIRSIPLKAN